MKKLKIGFITTSLSSHGGWDRCSKGVIPAMQKIADVKVLTQKVNRNEINLPNMWAVLPRESYNPFFQLRTFWYVMKYLRDCDVFHVMMEPFVPGVALASLFTGAPVFVTLAGTYAVPPRGYTPWAFFKRQMMRFMYSRVAMINSGSERAWRRAGEVVKMGPWRFIPNGVDPEEFHRVETNYPHSFLLTVGGVKPRKGVDFTIKALAILKDKFPNLHYKVVGEADSMEWFVKDVKELIAKNGLDERVHLLGRVDDEELRSLYSGCDIFVLAAQTIAGAYEGFPMVFYEAQGCGAPIISTYGFGSEYVVKNGYNGFLVKEGDIEPLAEAIEKIVGDKDLQKQMVKNSLVEAEKHSWDNTAKIYHSMYDDYFAGKIKREATQQ